MNQRTTLILALAASALLSACQRQASLAPFQGVAQVGDATITSAQLQQKLTERHRRDPATLVTAADRNAALDELVQFEALFAQAQRAGWHTNADLVASFKRSVVARFQEAHLAKNRASAPSEAEIRGYYEQHSSQFTRAALTRGAVLLFETPAKATPEKRAEVAARAEELRAQAIQDAAREPHFGSLAQRHSFDQATRYAGGDFGLLTLGEIESRYGTGVSKALATLKSAGEISAVLETPRGLGLVKLIERRPESRLPLAQVRDGIAYQIAKMKQGQAEREFQRSAQCDLVVRVNQAVLESIPLPTRADAPPAGPGPETAQVNP